MMRTTLLLCVLVLPLTSCASGTAWRLDEGLGAQSIEMQVDRAGVIREIEYHVLPSEVPAAVHAAMDRLHPGGSATGAERETQGGSLYWELKKSIGGRDIEAMFTPDGTLHSAEIEVERSAVPEAVRSAVQNSGYGTVRVWEEIRDSAHAVVEYHVKTTNDGKNYKLLVAVDGAMLGVYREIPAEIELAVR